MQHLIALSLGLSFLASPLFADGHATGNPSKGEKVFAKCKACHMVASSDEIIVKGGNVGPNLYGIYNRKAGTQTEYSKYGKSIVSAGNAGLQWNEEAFLTYVANPKDFLIKYLEDKKARSNMAFKLKSEDDAKNVWAYLVSLSSEN